MENKEKDEVFNCQMKLRENPQRRKEKVYIGCGAGFAGDRPLAALKLLERVKELDYLVLECLAERTLADRYQIMMSGGDGFDSRNWMSLLLPLAVERGVCIITNMGAVDPLGAQQKVLEVGSSLGLHITVSVAYEVSVTESGLMSSIERANTIEGGVSTYMGASPIVRCLEKHKPHVIITSRVADAALFLGPMVYELGWNWNDFEQLAQGSLAGHLLECGCQLTGGYFMHPVDDSVHMGSWFSDWVVDLMHCTMDKMPQNSPTLEDPDGDCFRDLSFQQMLDLSLPYAEVGFHGEVYVAKADDSGGIINFNTCAEQLLYEVGDPSAYITPDVVIDFRDVSFHSISNDRVHCKGAKPSHQCFPEKLLQLIPKDCGWKGWGEISYGGYGCTRRAKAADLLVRSWLKEVFPGVNDRIISYIIGFDSLKATNICASMSSMRDSEDIRLRMDGLFELKQHALHFVNEFTALYTNGPAGGGGISTGYKKEIILQKELVRRECVFWRIVAKQTETINSSSPRTINLDVKKPITVHGSLVLSTRPKSGYAENNLIEPPQPAPSGQKIPLYQVGHSRAGDKGNDLNFSIIPHFSPDVERLKAIITPTWVKAVVSTLLDESSFPNSDAIDRRNAWIDEHVRVEIYEVKAIRALNVVVRNILDGGVNCSRRIDRHGKCVSDLILCQHVVLPP